jgi:tetratricopeptide (TPR) repeat protein
MNIKYIRKIFNKHFSVNILAILVLLLTAVGWNGCATQRKISDVKARSLRDSAWKYGWAGLNWARSSKYYDTLFTSKYILKKDYYNAGQVAAELGNYSKCIAIWSKMLKIKNDDEYDYEYYLPGMVGPQFDYYEGLIHAKGFDKL